MSRITLTAALAVCFSSPSFAADLILDCKVKQTMADGSQYDFERKLEITWEASRVTFYDNRGSGWTRNNSYQFLSADNARINLRNDSVAMAYVDRRTGEYYLRSSRGEIIRGTCERGEALQVRF